MRAGKSTVAKFLQQSLNIPIVSFGGYLVNYAEKNNLLPTRDVLQDIGNSLVREDPVAFLKSVFAYANISSDSAIVEGIRHRSIIENLRHIAEKVALIYIDLDVQTRYERYCSGQKASDTVISFEEFIKKDNHPVESEIESLKLHSQIISGSDEQSNASILDQLNSLGLLANTK